MTFEIAVSPVADDDRSDPERPAAAHPFYDGQNRGVGLYAEVKRPAESRVLAPPEDDR